MSDTDLQKRVMARIESLSAERLRVADDFLAYLAAIESAEATDELLRMPGLREAIHEARDEAKNGGALTPLDQVKWKA